MSARIWRLSRIAREAGCPQVDDALLSFLIDQGFDVDSRDAPVSGPDVKRIRQAIRERAQPQPSAPVEKPLWTAPKWPSGAPEAVNYLSFEEVNEIHRALVDEFRGTDDAVAPPGLKDPSVLDSAVKRGLTAPQKYFNVTLGAAATTHSLVLNHPFHNGLFGYSGG